MSHWVYCNACFLRPSADHQLAVTTCGHVICSVCYQKGKPGKCLICSTQCQVSALSEKSSPEVKAVFSDISVVATKHLAEISQVLKFQARQQKRHLSYYQQKSEKLEEVSVKMRQEMQEMTKKLNEQSTYIVKLKNSLQHLRVKQASAVPQMSHMSQTPHGQKAVRQLPCNSPISLSRHLSVSNMNENMEVEERSPFRKPTSVPRLSIVNPPQDARVVRQLPCNSPISLSQHLSVSNMNENMEVEERSPFRKPTSVPRLSIVNPPQDARVGPNRSPIQNNMSAKHSASSATVSRFQGAPLTPDMSYSHTRAWNSLMFKPPSSVRHSMSSWVSPPP